MVSLRSPFLRSAAEHRGHAVGRGERSDSHHLPPSARTRSPPLCGSRFQIADKESRGALPCLIRVAAKTQHAAESALAGRDIDNAQAQAADQRADLIDRTNQHPIRMNQPGQVTLAAVAPVERLSGPRLVDLATDRDWIDDRVEPMRSQLPREVERQCCQSIFVLLGSRRCLAGSIRPSRAEARAASVCPQLGLEVVASRTVATIHIAANGAAEPPCN